MDIDFEVEFTKTAEYAEIMVAWNKAVAAGDKAWQNMIWEKYDKEFKKFIKSFGVSVSNSANTENNQGSGVDEGAVREIIDEMTMLDSLRKDLTKNIEELNERYVLLRDRIRGAYGY